LFKRGRYNSIIGPNTTKERKYSIKIVTRFILLLLCDAMYDVIMLLYTAYWLIPAVPKFCQKKFEKRHKSQFITKPP
jgi:hypothetical protein